jgi:hypothetical protein
MLFINKKPSASPTPSVALHPPKMCALRNNAKIKKTGRSTMASVRVSV